MNKGVLAGIGFLGLFAIGFDAGTYFSAKSTMAFLSTAQKGEGKVVSLVEKISRDSKNRDSRTFAPVFEFATTDQKLITVESTVSSNPPGYAIGEVVHVLYDPRTPQNARLDSFVELWMASLILGIFGMLTSLGFVALVVSTIRKAKLRAWLAENGTTINAKVTSVSLNTNLKVNGQSPWEIRCEWLDPKTQTIYQFKSDHLWSDPTPYVNGEVAVVIDAANPARYHLTVDFLPKVIAA